MGCILLAEDSAVARKHFKKVLEAAGHKIVSTANGEEALNCARMSPPDAVVTDLEMPVLDGYGLIRGIRELDSDKHRSLPILVLTSHSTREQVVKAIQLGANDFVSKSNLKPSVLVEKISALLDPGATPGSSNLLEGAVASDSDPN